MKKRLLCFVLFVALAFLSSSLTACLQVPVVWAESGQATIEAVDSSIRQAFTAVLDAEKAGGNVTQLLAELNVAGALLAEAENDYRTGNLGEVTVKTGNARQIAENVRNEALNLRDASLVKSQNVFLFTLAFSAIGAVEFTVALVLGWKHFRNIYMRKLLKKKPEVVTDET